MLDHQEVLRCLHRVVAAQQAQHRVDNRALAVGPAAVQDWQDLLAYLAGEGDAAELLPEFDQSGVVGEDEFQRAQPFRAGGVRVVDRRREFGDQVGLAVRPYQGRCVPPEVQCAVLTVEQPRVGVQGLRQDRDDGLGRRESDHRRHPFVIFRFPRPYLQTRHVVVVIHERHFLRLYRPCRAFRALGENPRAVAVPAATVPVEPLAPRVAVPDPGTKLVRQPLAVANVRVFVQTGQRSRLQPVGDRPRLSLSFGPFCLFSGLSGPVFAGLSASRPVTVWRHVLAVA